MDADRAVDVVSIPPVALSRRLLMRSGGVGTLALALMAAGIGPASAEDGTPVTSAATPTEGGLPPGVSPASLITAAPIDELPNPPAELYVTRITIAPGVYFPPTPTPGPETVLVESGVLTCRCGALGHPCSVLRAPDNRREEQPIDKDFTLSAGDVLLQPANVPDSAANNGNEPLVILVVDIFPSSGPATPSA